MRKRCISYASILLLGLAVCSVRTAQAADAAQMLRATGCRGGLVVHIGCGDGKLSAGFCRGPQFVVHALDRDPANVERARDTIRSSGLYGQASVEILSGSQLPYVDNLVNLLIAEDLHDIPMAEVMRVLCPNGSALIGGRRFVKPWPESIDQWSHFLHGPDNNAVAEDQVVGPPRHMQWLAGPKWTRHHHADKGTYPTIRAVVSTEGRLYYMVDETRSSNRTVPSRWYLAARDAFNGVLLWKRPAEIASFEPRLEQLWRTLVADGDRVYSPHGADQSLVAIDGLTGNLIRKYPGTAGFQEVIQYEDVLLVSAKDNHILAFHANTARPRWQWTPNDGETIVPVTLAAAGSKVFVKTDTGVSCLSVDDGSTLWQIQLPGSKKKIRLKFPRERLIVKDGVVLCSYGGEDPISLNRDTYEFLGSHPRVREYGGKLAALSADTGEVVWKTDYFPGLESMPGEIYIANQLVWLGPTFDQPRDLHTGKVTQTRGVIERLWSDGHHYRCYPGKATSRYILTAKRGIELIDLIGDSHSRDNWVRATCRVGVTPCNGLLYAPPHSCGCYMETKLFGFWALAPKRSSNITSSRSAQPRNRLEKGPAYGKLPVSQPVSPRIDSWPTFRHDAARSGSTGASLSHNLNESWRTQLGGRLSAVTVAEGKVFVAQVDAHTVHALDARTGGRLWQFTAGGRVDSPPTFFRGVLLFGSRDGWVYCLRASDGVLVWRFLAAPQQVNSIAFDQVESLWPIHGTVLVHESIAYVAAGRSSYLDGGLVLYGLTPETGQVQYTTRLRSDHVGATPPPPAEQRTAMRNKISQNTTDYKTYLAADRSDAFSMRGIRNDVLTAEGDSLFLRHLRFDHKLVQNNKSCPHLFSTSDLLDDSEHNRSYRVLGTADFSRTPVAYPWIVRKSLAVPYGLMLAFDDRSVFGIHRRGKEKDPWREYSLFVAPRPKMSDAQSALPDFARRTDKAQNKTDLWETELALRPRALVRAKTDLFVAGMPYRADPGGSLEQIDLAVSTRGPGMLQLFSGDDGTSIRKWKLAAPPVWDGMAVIDSQLFLVDCAGGVLSLESSE